MAVLIDRMVQAAGLLGFAAYAYAVCHALGFAFCGPRFLVSGSEDHVIVLHPAELAVLLIVSGSLTVACLLVNTY